MHEKGGSFCMLLLKIAKKEGKNRPGMITCGITLSPQEMLGVDRENTRGNRQLKKRFSGAECASLGVPRRQRSGGGGRATRPQRFCPVQNRADVVAAAVAAGGAR
jgi:hypothetical protein